LTRKFVTHVLGNETPKGNCFGICFTLSLYLKNNGIENFLKSGYVNGKDPHYIIILKDNERIIIDPTIHQFDIWKPLVFIGKKPKNYGEFSSFEFNRIYDIWQYPLLNDGMQEPIPEPIKVQRKTALSDELTSKMRKKYFNTINQMAIKYCGKKEELIDPFLLTKFNNLL
jgi:hypothetical protein